AFRKDCLDGITQHARSKPIDQSLARGVIERCFYVQGDYGSADDHAKLARRLESLDEKYKTGGNRLFYLSTPPTQFEPIISRLGERPAAPEGAWRRIIIEK